MKKKITTSLFLAAFTCLVSPSCKNNGTNQNNSAPAAKNESNAKNNNELKGFLLAGIYAVNGYGGASDVAKQLESSDAGGQLKLFEFPFEKGQDGVKETLASNWDIHSPDGLKKKLEELLNTDKSLYKAWDYARLVNNVNMGYAAGYLTKEEGMQWVAKTLPKAQAAFKTWADYHANFMEGRKKWSPNDDDTQSFEALSKEINDMEIYKNNPLN